jgi:hypothetical protein
MADSVSCNRCPNFACPADTTDSKGMFRCYPCVAWDLEEIVSVVGENDLADALSELMVTSITVESKGVMKPALYRRAAELVVTDPDNAARGIPSSANGEAMPTSSGLRSMCS